MLGGKCKICESENNLEFDHIDPITKSFCMTKFLNVSKEKALEELNKCQLLCSECHKNKSSNNKDYIKNRAMGSRMKNSVLNEDLVTKIKLDRRAGMTLNQLVKKYNHKKGTLNKVISGHTWKHVEI